jgi:hypothetical protein
MKTKPGNTPTDKGGTAGRRRRHAATSIGVAALLALGGVLWASSHGASRASNAQDAQTGATASTPPEAAPPDVAPSEVSEPATATAPTTTPLAPIPAEPSAAPADPPASGEVDPAPVDRKGKSEEELATIPQPVAAPVPLEAKKTVKSGVSATITEIAAVQGVATGIGEVAGPAVRFKVTVVNDTATALSLDGALVDVSYGNDEEPATSLSGPDPVAFPSSVAPGSSGTGVFVFAVPPDTRDKLTIHFSLEAETPIATFAGQAPA